jgi:O-antigen/teichoic acid export membrane protein
MAVALIGFLTTAIMILIAVGRRAGAKALRPRWSRALGDRLLLTATGLHPGTVALQLGSRVDLLIVGGLAATRSTGLYSLALTLAGSAYLVTQTLSLNALHRQTQDELEGALRFTAAFTRQALALALVTCGLVSAVAYPFVVVVYGTGWRGAVVPFIILVVAVVAMAPEETARQMLYRVGRPAQISVVACAGVVLNAAVTVAMVGPLGITGAALGSLVAFWAYAALMIGLLVRATGMGVGELLALPRRGDPLFELVDGAARRLRLRASRPTAS